MNIENFVGIPEYSFRSIGNGCLVYACVLKKTYTINGQCEMHIKHKQLGANLIDEYYGDPKSSSLRTVHDRVPFKPKGEIYFVEPISRPPTHVALDWPVSIQVGSIVFQFRVSGPRYYHRGILGWELSKPAKSKAVQVRFENTYGGGYSADPTKLFDMNPVGKGYGLERVKESSVPAPQILNSNGKIPKTPIAITPLHRGWAPRRQLAGTFDDEWRARGLPMYPDDFDFHFYQQAPGSLQLQKGFFAGNESVKITGIGSAPTYQFKLDEKDEFVWLVEDDTGEVSEHRFNLDTLIFDLEESEISLVWRSAIITESETLASAIFNKSDLDE